MTSLLITLAFLFIVIPIGWIITMKIVEKGNKDTYVEGLMGEDKFYMTKKVLKLMRDSDKDFDNKDL